MREEKKTTKQKPPKRKLIKNIIMILLVLFGVVLIVFGVSVFYYNLNTDSEGYVYSNEYYVNTPTYAFTAYMNNFELSPWDVFGASNVADIKFIVKPTDLEKEIFMGYATTSASQAYRDSFLTEFPTNWSWETWPYHAQININNTLTNGAGEPTEYPQLQNFWLISAQDSGVLSMNYLPLNEQHVWFIMNSDKSRNITAHIQIAFRSPILSILPPILLIFGLIFIVTGVYFIRKKNKIIAK